MKNAAEIHAAILAAKSLDDLAAIETALEEIKEKITSKSHQYLTDAMMKRLDNI